ncbi:hypothetical protein NP493_985g00043 [Ridgeia piscesae]|uniref:Uncharacterized protein n=1 Tax=Ridgeia piscesae TaxID=27915 RepID=A0AAD9KJB8_RIDPI|nr:hypothetical protein NP493_985g00043 [Ridgeia piscesae]
MKKTTQDEDEDEDYDDDDGSVVYTQVTVKPKQEQEKKSDQKTDDDEEIVYTEVAVKPKPGKDGKKKQVVSNPPLAPKPVGKENQVGNGKKQKPGKTGNPTTAHKPKVQDKKGKAPKKEEAKNAEGGAYVNTKHVENEMDNLYANVEKSANAESQKPPEDIGPDGTIYADLTFAQSAPAAVKHDEDEDEDDDKVVYAAIDFKKNT